MQKYPKGMQKLGRGMQCIKMGKRRHLVTIPFSIRRGIFYYKTCRATDIFAICNQ